jgi:transcriptional regulator with XRE-family HTH domain
MQTAHRQMPSTSRAELARLAVQMSEEAERIGKRMREIREGMRSSSPRSRNPWPSQAEMAGRLPGNVQGAEWSRWETGRHRPDPDHLPEIAEVLETTVGDLYAGPMADRDEETRSADSPLEALSAPASAEEVADLRERLGWIENALEAMAAAQGLELDARPSEQDRPQRSDSSGSAPGN